MSPRLLVVLALVALFWTSAASALDVSAPVEDKGMQPDIKDVRRNLLVQLERARELRLAAKELLQAAQGPEAARTFAQAREILGKIPPGQRDFSVQQEEVLQLEDQRIYGTAITRWNALMKSPQLIKKVALNKQAKKTYFDCLYHLIYCWYEYGKNHKVPAKQTEYIRRAADYIVRLETAKDQDGWHIIGGRLCELLRAEESLRTQYEALKKPPPLTKHLNEVSP